VHLRTVTIPSCSPVLGEEYAIDEMSQPGNQAVGKALDHQAQHINLAARQDVLQGPGLELNRDEL